MVKLDTTRTTVAPAVRATASSTPSDGHTGFALRSENQAANSPAKNMSSDANQTTTPTDNAVGREASRRAAFSKARASLTALVLVHPNRSQRPLART